MIKTQRPSFFYSINSRPVSKFRGKKIYVSTGDSDDMENGDLVTYFDRPSRANVQPKVNDVLFAKMANTSKTFLVDEQLSKMIFSTGFFDISSTKIEPRFLYYLIQSDEFNCYKNAYSEGTTQVSISDKRLKKIRITFEQDIVLQRKIVRCLDKALARIDSIIGKLKCKEELLDAYQNDLINSAITGNLSSASKVSSGFSWIGEIPSNWKIRRLRLLGDFQNGISAESSLFGYGYPFVNYTDAYNSIVLPSNVKGLINSTQSDRARLSVKYGDVFFTRTSETIEEIGFASTCLETIPDAVFSGFLIRFRPYDTSAMLPKYFKYYFRSSILRHYFVKEMNIVTRCSLGQGLLKNLPVLIPTLEEQEKIASYLDKKCNSILEINNIIAKDVDALNDYKRSLIFEYVSGKKEVD